MHFTFNYIPHTVEKLQEYLDFLFYEVWIKASGEFNADKLEGHPELQKVYVDLGYKESKWAQFFNSSIEKIFKEFIKVNDDAFKASLIEGYANNNNIERLCKDTAVAPMMYKDIKSRYPDLEKALKSFYSKLYGSDSPFNLEVFGFLSTKMITAYDEQFMGVNNKGICPFCALNDLKGNNHSYREAYDHYIPKGIYPFNVLNFRNLSPMCHECNSTYKLVKSPIEKRMKKKDIDPLKLKKYRTKAFYPYDEVHPELTIDIELTSTDIKSLSPKNIILHFRTDIEAEEEINSWRRVFGLDERYKAVLCSPNDGIGWYNSIVDEFENVKEISEIKEAETYYKNVLKAANKQPLSGRGFLKSKFLEECKKKGMFDFSLA